MDQHVIPADELLDLVITSLNSLHVTVLHLVRTSLKDIDGIAALPALEELYLAFNAIADLSPLAMLDNLTVLDLEANALDSLDALEYLVMVPSLEALSLEDTPLYARYPSVTAARGAVVRLLPAVAFVDDVPRADVLAAAESEPPADASAAGVDQEAALVAASLARADAPLATILQDAYGVVLDDEERALLEAIADMRATPSAFAPPAASIARPATSAGRILPPRPSTSAGLRPATPAAAAPIASSSPALSGPASELTLGHTRAMSGNPALALRKRRKAGVAVAPARQRPATAAGRRPRTAAGPLSAAATHTVVRAAAPSPSYHEPEVWRAPDADPAPASPEASPVRTPSPPASRPPKQSVPARHALFTQPPVVPEAPRRRVLRASRRAARGKKLTRSELVLAQATSAARLSQPLPAPAPDADLQRKIVLSAPGGGPGIPSRRVVVAPASPVQPKNPSGARGATPADR
ncbi:leucine-rich repeat-containing protein 56 [Thecamonas trahens ATCC 50062]|uniref:Leucine-rich repeat-containing protein 56 n=1 Tax=Thecamonas trahens ATCC 50062 TaxID=461836 RepID=A0A0L0DPQ2_THETB|nr:leucine-rich repeat-containing protein 56 [Thecamonas trahens ATCC 50062]KNC54277.1 leucine-rich repeat-containing protein 56 [Thecamonas trahens ATCC 50062]|eukprot:XP_013753909.1 leucine-rich repeat-containing protein 56 [Thecamonas trahens ATCC 50062]